MRERQERLDKSWQTRTLAAYVAMGYWIGKDEENKPLEAAKELSLDDIEVDLLKKVKDMPPEVQENTNGSFERLMLAFGKGIQKE